MNCKQAYLYAYINLIAYGIVYDEHVYDTISATHMKTAKHSLICLEPRKSEPTGGLQISDNLWQAFKHYSSLTHIGKPSTEARFYGLTIFRALRLVCQYDAEAWTGTTLMFRPHTPRRCCCNLSPAAAANDSDRSDSAAAIWR